MARLIDANNFKRFLQALCDAGAPYEGVIQLLDKESTAYDVEKVVAELEEKLVCDDFGTCNYCQYRWCSMKLLEADEAIDIVRKGGIE